MRNPPERFGRRQMLQVGLLSALGLTLRDSWFPHRTFGAGTPATADACIFVHLKGGQSHLDTLDMKPEAPSEERGEFQRIDTVIPSYQVCEHLPKLAKVIDRFTLIRGIQHSTGDHPKACEYLFTGNRPTPAVVHPSLGSVANRELKTRPAIPPFVAVPNSDMSPGYLGVSHGSFKTTAVPKQGQPFEVRGLSIGGGMTLEKVKARNQLLRDLDQTFRTPDANSPLLEGLDRFADKANEMILSDEARQAFDVGRESPEILKLFEQDDLSQSLLLAGRLVEHGVRFVTVTHDGWDTHLENFTGHKKLLGPLDAALPALIQMLEQKELLQRILVVVTGEFGRTPTINKNAGRDHWPQVNCALLAGGGVKRAFFLGGTDKKGHAPDADTKLKLDDLAATILRALGIDPLTEYFTPTGRPILLVPESRVLTEVFTSLS